ncbi:MAG: DUF1289 domain-containing protein [Brachymonas sp.]|nr:DUF1289 domain-containing protein [Brachymonas sp.]
MNAPAPSSATSHAEIAARAQAALAAPAGEVPSPCIQRCQINPANGYCRGCWRNLQEISTWQKLDDASKRQIWHETVARSQAQAAC